MNIPNGHDQDVSGTNPALLAALTTEHFSLQSARSSTIVEANGRSMRFLSAVSGAIVALALVAQVDSLGQTFTVFALSVLPALLALGLTSYARLADLAVHDAHYALAIGRIRAFYLTIEPSGRQYWLQPAGDDPYALMRQNGQAHSRWHHLSHTATSVAAINAVLAGALVGFVLHITTSSSLSAVGVASTVIAIAVVAGLMLDQERRWRRSEQAQATTFFPDGTPAMTVHRRAGAAPTPKGAGQIAQGRS